MKPTQKPDNPILNQLQQELAQGNTAALDAFWKHVASEGSPIIQPIGGDPGNALVTFVWREEERLKNVVVLSRAAEVMSEFYNETMTRMPNSDLWYRTYRLPTEARMTYMLSPNDPLTPIGVGPEAYNKRVASFRPDPLNALTFSRPDEESTWSVLEMPDSPPQPWITPGAGARTGKVKMHSLRSEILGNQRRVWIHTPPDYGAETRQYGALVLLDGFEHLHAIPTPVILDNLLAEDRVQPVVAILIDHIDWQKRWEEVEQCYAPFIDFLVKEAMPWASRQYRISPDPSQTTIGGFSGGGTCAAFAALCHPEVFGNVLSQSGGFSFTPKEEKEGGWLIRRFARSDRLPLKFYLNVGVLESRSFSYGGRVSNLDANRHMRDVLIAKGYDVHYSEFCGGHEFLCWRGMLSDGLLALMGRNELA